MSCVGVKYPTVKKNIDYTGTIDLKYTGQTIPKRNVRVNVNLNLKYKFENFVVGENNKNACAIAKSKSFFGEISQNRLLYRLSY